jgi:glycine cleavage system H protein
MGNVDLMYTDTHEWLSIEDGEATIGLTEYAQGELGDIVFIELPEVGRAVETGDVLTTVESVKSVSEIYAPVAGEITGANEALDEDPGLINTDAEGEGWILKMRLAPDADLSVLMTAEDYEAHTKG